jgi:hypothetical protein
MGRTVSVLAAVLAAMVAGAAQATTPVQAQGITGPELAAILQEAGYRARLETDGEGEPLVRTGMGGVEVAILFYDCNADHRCNSLQFSAGFDLPEGTTDAVVNGFNRDYRYARAFLDEERDPFLHFDFEVVHTAQAEYIRSQIDSYEQLLPEFQRLIGFNG